jgi:hypothetical protein
MEIKLETEPVFYYVLGLTLVKTVFRVEEHLPIPTKDSATKRVHVDGQITLHNYASGTPLAVPTILLLMNPTINALSQRSAKDTQIQ